jgi:hypothetical protein
MGVFQDDMATSDENNSQHKNGGKLLEPEIVEIRFHDLGQNRPRDMAERQVELIVQGKPAEEQGPDHQPAN